MPGHGRPRITRSAALREVSGTHTTVDTSVFICYRRSVSWALANLIRDDLERHGWDVWLDTVRLRVGEFEPRIRSEIARRRHFVVVLQPGSLQDIEDPDDWLHPEIACALAH